MFTQWTRKLIVSGMSYIGHWVINKPICYFETPISKYKENYHQLVVLKVVEQS